MAATSFSLESKNARESFALLFYWLLAEFAASAESALAQTRTYSIDACMFQFA